MTAARRKKLHGIQAAVQEKTDVWSQGEQGQSRKKISEEDKKMKPLQK